MNNFFKFNLPVLHGGLRVEKIRKILSFDFNITKVGNKFYGIDHITTNVINIYSKPSQRPIYIYLYLFITTPPTRLYFIFTRMKAMNRKFKELRWVYVEKAEKGHSTIRFFCRV